MPGSGREGKVCVSRGVAWWLAQQVLFRHGGRGHTAMPYSAYVCCSGRKKHRRLFPCVTNWAGVRMNAGPAMRVYSLPSTTSPRVLLCAPLTPTPTTQQAVSCRDTRDTATHPDRNESSKSQQGLSGIATPPPPGTRKHSPRLPPPSSSEASESCPPTPRSVST